MKTMRDGKGRRRADRRRGISIESLECRSMLTTVSETFTGPSLTGLIAQAEHGKKENAAITNRMVQALESQLQAGPLTDLNSGLVTTNDFIVEAQSLELSYEQDVDQQLTGRFANKTDLLLGSLGQVLDLDGQRVVANLVSLNQQNAAMLISSAEFSESSQSVISSLTNGPIHPLGTSLSGMASTTSAVTSQLALLSQNLAEGVFTVNPGGPRIPLGGSPSPTLNDELITIKALNLVNLTLDAELEGYRASVQAATRVTQPGIAEKAETAINTLENAVSRITRTDLSDASSELNSDINTFAASVLDTTGVFGSRGAYRKVPKTVNLPPGFTDGQASSYVVNVSGTASLTSSTSGTATLTATLASVNGSAIGGQTVNFTIDGAFVGTAVTNSTGVAILSGLTTTDATVGRNIGGIFTNSSGVLILSGGTITAFDAFGTETGGIVATFAGNPNFVSSQGKGNLVVSEAATAVSSVSGTAE